jgi:outer membrane protein insertion porin family
LTHYIGPTSWNVTGETLTVGQSDKIRSAAGVGLIWDSPFGPLRVDLAWALSKVSYDKTQLFRFGGGTRF